MHGAHIASIGGTWMALIYGFAGMRDAGGRVSFRPSLPEMGKQRQKDGKGRCSDRRGG